MTVLALLAAALGVGFILIVALLRRKPEDRIPMGHAKAPPERHLAGAYVSRDELCMAIGTDFSRAVMLDGQVIHAGKLPPVPFVTHEKGGVVNPMPTGSQRPQGAPGQPAGAPAKPCGGCGGGRHPRGPQPAAAQGLPPGAQELHSGFVAGGSPSAPAPEGSSAPASTRPAPRAAAHSGQGGAVPQKADLR